MKSTIALPISTLFMALNLLSTPVKSADLLPYQNKDLSAQQRVDDLITRMTLREKAGQMSQFVGLEHIKESESKLTAEQLNSSDAHGFYPGLRPADLLEMIEKSEIGSFFTCS